MRRLLLLFLALAALAAAPALAADKIKVGIMGGDAEVLWARAKEIAARDGLDINLVVFSDYLLPNEALRFWPSSPSTARCSRWACSTSCVSWQSRRIRASTGWKSDRRSARPASRQRTRSTPIAPSNRQSEAARCPTASI